jgi:hypothetical protein
MTDVGGVQYEAAAIEREAVVVGRGARPPHNLVIPPTVTIDGRASCVTEIALTAFVSAALTSLQLPATVRAIGGAPSRRTRGCDRSHFHGMVN